jgi:hypothetical protein
MVRRRPNVAVQYTKNDSGEPEPADFTMPEVVPTFNNINPSNGCVPGMHKGETLPLKYLQYGSDMTTHYNADTPAETAQLDIPNYYPAEISDIYKSQPVAFPDFPAPFDYNAGIRASVRPLHVDMVSEPAPAILYRTDRGVPSKRVAEGITFDVGVEELRKMAARPKLLRPDDLFMRLPALERPD